MGFIASTLRSVVPALLIVMAATGCTGEKGREPSSRPSTSAESLPTPRGTAATCSTTAPSPASIPGHRADVLFGADRAYGNGKLWVGGLGEGGVLRAGPRLVGSDGSIRWKLGWWRGVPGALEITGRRLDAFAPPLRAAVPSGYGRLGFQSSGVSFPTEGCWSLTGAVGRTTLTFVVSVVAT